MEVGRAQKRSGYFEEEKILNFLESTQEPSVLQPATQ